MNINHLIEIGDTHSLQTVINKTNAEKYLETAVAYGNFQSIKYIFGIHPIINDRLMFVAVIGGHYQIVKLFIAHKINIGMTNSFGHSLLERSHNDRCINILLLYGANIPQFITIRPSMKIYQPEL
jgi:hypothetical protein